MTKTNDKNVTSGLFLFLNHANIDRLPFTCANGFFICTKSTKQCIAPQFVCNGQADCAAEEDELNCKCSISNIFMHFNISCFWQLFLRRNKSGKLDLLSMEKSKPVSDRDFSSTGQQASISKQAWKGKLNSTSECSEHTFDVYNICFFNPDSKHLPSACPFGSHLKNCKSFHCSNKYKCPDSYCIPYRNVCNGKWDCPNGEDEKNICSKIECPGYFHCQGLNTCLHPSEICDGKVDCKNSYGDDEIFCINDYKCPAECICFGYGLACDRVNLNPFISHSYTILII